MTAFNILQILAERRQKIATAESCTGGLLAVRLSETPGASRVFAGSIVAYTVPAKVHVLGVQESIINKHGVVSEEVAGAMALQCRHKFASDWALSTTGYAGPSGGTLEAPLGTICIGISGPDGTQA